MVTYDINSANSAAFKFPTDLRPGDIVRMHNTSTGYQGTIINWDVPVSGIYKVEIQGAAGGGNEQGGTQYINGPDGGGGRGARMIGEFLFQKGDILKALIGQMGSSGYAAHGGGGGTFITTSNNVPLIVAGGGGGIRSGTSKDYSMLDASTSSRGKSGTNNTGGTNGGAGSSVQNGAGGAGFTGNAARSSDTRTMHTKTGAMSFVGGGTGGRLRYDSAAQEVKGGFGGGGAGGWGGAGGGGGYSGGGGGHNAVNAGFGGGGGSYNVGENQMNSVSTVNGHGYAYFTLVSLDSEPPSTPSGFTEEPAANSVYLSNESASIQWIASTHPEGLNITYTLELFTGSGWEVVANEIPEPFHAALLPSIDIVNAQFRVKAISEKGAESEYHMGNTFTIRRKLILIEDKGSIKAYANGDWQTIN